MMERIIEPDEYTPDILTYIDTIKDRMSATLTAFTDEDIIVLENEGTVYILGNPVLIKEPVFDEAGNLERMIPTHNITIVYDKQTTSPRLRILRPDLCMKMELMRV